MELTGGIASLFRTTGPDGPSWPAFGLAGNRRWTGANDPPGGPFFLTAARNWFDLSKAVASPIWAVAKPAMRSEGSFRIR
jgi:hypothetical protein